MKKIAILLLVVLVIYLTDFYRENTRPTGLLSQPNDSKLVCFMDGIMVGVCALIFVMGLAIQPRMKP